jgi:hypothetical protein
MEKVGPEFAFIDLRESNINNCLGNKFAAKLLGHQVLNGNWSSMTDGIFYIRNIHRSNIGTE